MKKTSKKSLEDIVMTSVMKSLSDSYYWDDVINDSDVIRKGMASLVDDVAKLALKDAKTKILLQKDKLVDAMATKMISKLLKG